MEVGKLAKELHQEHIRGPQLFRVSNFLESLLTFEELRSPDVIFCKFANSEELRSPDVTLRKFANSEELRSPDVTLRKFANS